MAHSVKSDGKKKSQAGDEASAGLLSTRRRDGSDGARGRDSGSHDSRSAARRGANSGGGHAGGLLSDHRGLNLRGGDLRGGNHGSGHDLRGGHGRGDLNPLTSGSGDRTADLAVHDYRKVSK